MGRGLFCIEILCFSAYSAAEKYWPQKAQKGAEDYVGESISPLDIVGLKAGHGAGFVFV